MFPPLPVVSEAATVRADSPADAILRSGWNTYGPTLSAARASSERLDESCWEIGRDPDEIRRAALLGLMPGTSWTSASHFEDLVHEWFDAGFTDVVFYDPPYGRAEVPIAPPDAIDELLSVTLGRLRRDLS